MTYVSPGVFIHCKVNPKSSKNKILILEQNENTIKIKVWLTTLPINNKANKQLLKIISKEFKIPKKQLVFVSGKTNNYKIIKINST